MESDGTYSRPDLSHNLSHPERICDVPSDLQRTITLRYAAEFDEVGWQVKGNFKFQLFSKLSSRLFSSEIQMGLNQSWNLRKWLEFQSGRVQAALWRHGAIRARVRRRFLTDTRITVWSLGYRTRAVSLTYALYLSNLTVWSVLFVNTAPTILDYGS